MAEHRAAIDGTTIAAAQREADLLAFRKWCADLELPFGTSLVSWHTFGVAFEDFLRGEPLAKL